MDNSMPLSFTSSFSISAIICKKCGTIDLPLVSAGTGPHALKPSCGACGTPIHVLSARSPEEKAARREAARHAAMASLPPTAPQLAYLRALGDSEAPPATMAEASKRIQKLRAESGVGR